MSLERERNELLIALEDWLETPMVVLVFVRLALLAAELIWGERRPFAIIGTTIGIVLIVDFVVRLALAPQKVTYLMRNWLPATSLLIPALLIFGIATPSSARSRGPASYGEALWWTMMVMTTLGSQHWPETFEGRALCVLLSPYAIGVFGYLTARFATYFVGRDAESTDAELAGDRDHAQLRQEVIALRDEIGALARRS